MFILDSLLIGSLRFVLDKVVQAAEAEAQDDSALREQLLGSADAPRARRDHRGRVRRDRARRDCRDPRDQGRQQGPISMSPQDRISGVDIGASTTTKFLFYGGKGGVGKTTCAAARGVAESARVPSTLVVSTDPAHSLGDALGVTLSAQPRQVAPGSTPSSSMPRGRSRAGCGSTAARSARFSSTAPGSITRTSTRCSTCRYPASTSSSASWRSRGSPPFDRGRGRRVSTASGYDVVVVDTAPTGHTLRLLAAPDAVAAGRRPCSICLQKSTA